MGNQDTFYIEAMLSNDRTNHKFVVVIDFFIFKWANEEAEFPLIFLER